MKKLIAIICTVAVLLAVSSCSSKPQTGGSGESSPLSSAENQSSNTPIASSVLEDKSTNVTFGHVGLGIQTQIPDFSLAFSLYSNGIMVYPHGFTLYEHDINNTYELSVEISIAGETNLEQLPITISNEKAAIPDVLSDERSWGLRKVTELHRTSNVQVGNYQTVYFEIDSPGVDKYEDAVIGYSFIFEEKPVCVTAYYRKDKDYTKEDLQEYLQYMILTLAPYQGEAFYELQPDNHINDFYGAIARPSVENLFVENAKGFTLYGYMGGTQSPSVQSDRGTHSDDLIYPYAYTYKDEYVVKCEGLQKEGLAYDGIFPLVLEDTDLKKAIDLWDYNGVTIEKEADVTIHGIQMKRYEAKISFNDTELFDFFVVYTFVYEDVPYLWKMDTDSIGIYKYTEEEAAYEMDMIRLQADTMIRTIQLKD